VRKLRRRSPKYQTPSRVTEEEEEEEEEEDEEAIKNTQACANQRGAGGEALFAIKPT